ncbi:MAG: hypothetical protein M1837_004901 [Sclerophora amabilis]|nr:MAG: hypothetical protein M1837_004901 [Sclerophora amabilis]
MSSMPTWLPDAAAINHNTNNHNNSSNNPNNTNEANANGNVFNPSMDNPAVLDPTMGFMQNPNAVDLQPFHQGPPLQHRMQNGNARNASPAFPTPVYQVPPVVPSKRPRPRDESLGTSPRQPSGGLPASRSQTPQQVPYPGFQNTTQHGHPQYAPPPNYQHLQQENSAHASPSPVMPNQPYRPPGMPPRVQTASPSPFSPAAQNFGSQASPPHSDHNSRVNTPHAGQPTPYRQGVPYPAGYNQPYAPSPGATSAPPPSSAPGPHMPPGPNVSQQTSNAQRLYQMKLQHQFQQNMMVQNRAQNGSGMSMGGSQPGQNPPHPPPNNSNSHNVNNNNNNNMNNPATAMRPQPPPMGRMGNPEQFLKSIVHFMQSRNQPLNTAPTIGDRTIHLMHLYAAVMRLGGSKKVTQSNAWPMVANNLQLPPAQYPTAAQEVKDHYERNLGPYEEAWIHMQQNQQSQNRQKAAMMHSGQFGPPPQPQTSPSKPAFPQAQPQSSPPQGPPYQQGHPPSTPAKQGPPPQNSVRQQPAMNGYNTPPQSNQVLNRGPHMYGQQRHTSGPPMDGTPPLSQQVPPFPPQSPVSAIKQNSIPLSGSPHVPPANHISAVPPKPAQIPENFEPAVRNLDTYGGIDVTVLGHIGAELAYHKPGAPLFVELGMIDIHALSMSLQSGIHAEVRLALDTLATLSVERSFQLSLQSCEDLVEILIDCAESQVDVLVESAPEVSDGMLLSPYEDVMRGCRLEVETLQDVPPFGSIEYELDRAVERLICITTILRNLSFFENNHELLADPIVVRFLSTVIRYLGTRNMLLRTNQNTLDFMKDIITYLSNLAQSLELPGKEEAMSILHFLLSFAPCPAPTSPGSDRVMFTSYQPSVHRYLPSAVDSLAKLLARDEPNRSYYKGIFAADVTSTPPFDLLTRTFALAISPVPENVNRNLTSSVEARKPYLIQGMLAAEILANLAPGPEHNLARSWLSSEDGFALSLLRLVCLLSTDRNAAPARHQTGNRMHDQDLQSYFPITHRGIAVLRRLAEKSQNPEDPSSDLPANILPKKESLLGALLHTGIDSNIIRQLCAYAGLEG